jgi:hypothetical protein
MRPTLIIGLLSSTLLLGGCADSGGHHNGGGHHGSHVQLNDLLDMRARNLDGEMADRGFRSTGGYKEHGASKTLWYNDNARQCVTVTTREGRVADIETIDKNNCL